MPGKSKLTADAAEQAALRTLSKSEQRGETDRARAILLTLEGRRAGEIAATLGVHVRREGQACGGGLRRRRWGAVKASGAPLVSADCILSPPSD